MGCDAKIDVLINGERQVVAAGVTLAGLLVDLGLEGKRLAVELNDEIVPRSQHSSWCINSGDRVEIVQAIGGG